MREREREIERVLVIVHKMQNIKYKEQVQWVVLSIRVDNHQVDKNKFKKQITLA